MAWMCYDDLSEEAKGICDDVIFTVGRCNGTDEEPDDVTRRLFWNEVFAFYWTTDSEVRLPPDDLPSRTMADSAYLVGYFWTDLPPSRVQARIARRENTVAVIPPHRRQGAPAYLRPSTQLGAMRQENWIDGKNGLACYRWISFYHDANIHEARVSAIQHYNTHEWNRIGGFNHQLAVHLGQIRLI